MAREFVWDCVKLMGRCETVDSVYSYKPCYKHPTNSPKLVVRGALPKVLLTQELDAIVMDPAWVQSIKQTLRSNVGLGVLDAPTTAL
jgi:hypothetical protein